MIKNASIERLAAFLRNEKKTLACVESCTGGRFSAALTAIPGASDFFWGGIVVYSNDSKRRLAGIETRLLANEGPVSAVVASALAEQARRLSCTDYSVAITGLAGPGGQLPGLPIGTVFIAVASVFKKPNCRHFMFSGNRGTIMDTAVSAAISFLYDELSIQVPNSSKLVRKD